MSDEQSSGLSVAKERYQLLASSWAPLWREESRSNPSGRGERARVPSVPRAPSAGMLAPFFPEENVEYGVTPLEIEVELRKDSSFVFAKRVDIEPWTCMTTVLSEGVLVAFWSSTLVLEVTRLPKRS